MISDDLIHPECQPGGGADCWGYIEEGEFEGEECLCECHIQDFENPTIEELQDWHDFYYGLADEPESFRKNGTLFDTTPYTRDTSDADDWADLMAWYGHSHRARDRVTVCKGSKGIEFESLEAALDYLDAFLAAREVENAEDSRSETEHSDR